MTRARAPCPDISTSPSTIQRAPRWTRRPRPRDQREDLRRTSANALPLDKSGSANAETQTTAMDDTQPSDVTLPSLLQIAHSASSLTLGRTNHELQTTCSIVLRSLPTTRRVSRHLGPTRPDRLTIWPVEGTSSASMSAGQGAPATAAPPWWHASSATLAYGAASPKPSTAPGKCETVRCRAAMSRA